MMNRRTFMASAAAMAATPSTARAAQTPTGRQRVPDEGSFDPWVEILADAIRNNVRELHRHSGCRLLAVIKNNANGIGLREIGPILDGMEEVYGLAVARVDEALALREVGVTKPVVLMAHASRDEAELLVREGVTALTLSRRRAFDARGNRRAGRTPGLYPPLYRHRDEPCRDAVPARASLARSALGERRRPNRRHVHDVLGRAEGR